VLGQDYPVFAWVNFDAVDDPNSALFINVTFTYGAFGFPAFATLYKNPDPDVHGWELRGLGSMTYGVAGFPITADQPLFIVGHQNFNPGTVLIDTIYIGEDPFAPVEVDMAVMLAEYAVLSVMSKALTSLNAEIAYVKAEAALGVDLPAFTAWRGYDCGAATPDVVEFECFETGDTTFPAEEFDQSTWQSGARIRTVSKTPMRAAINHANRGDTDAADATLLASQMAERSRLYGAALYRCFRNDPTCGQGVIVAIIPRAVRYNVRGSTRLTPEIRRAARVEFDFDVYLRESPSGETLAGGANLPSTSLETP
jgi:hypothetical protein